MTGWIRPALPASVPLHDGQYKELHTIGVPSVSEQQRREIGRQREFWRGLILTMANHGRALRLEHEGRVFPVTGVTLQALARPSLNPLTHAAT